MRLHLLPRECKRSTRNTIRNMDYRIPSIHLSKYVSIVKSHTNVTHRHSLSRMDWNRCYRNCYLRHIIFPRTGNILENILYHYINNINNRIKISYMTEFRTMRRKRQELSKEDCIKILKEATSGTLSVIGDDGYPYGVPISYFFDNNKIFFHSATNGHKVDAIRNNENASFTIIEKDEIKPDEYTTYFRSVICFGKVHIIDDEKNKLDTLYMLGNKYNPNDKVGLQHEIEKSINHVFIIQFDIEHITGKESIELVRMKEKK